MSKVFDKNVQYRTHLDDYAEYWQDLAHLTRRDGILEVRFHWDNGPFRWNEAVHGALAPLFMDISYDPDTECVIITGTGDVFVDQFDPESHRRKASKGFAGGHITYDEWWVAQPRFPAALMDIPVPVIGAVNGPAIIHPEILLLSDVVIAAEHAYFSDRHYTGVGIVPSDGGNILYRELLGHNRGRAYLYLGHKIDAAQAKDLGMVAEVLPADQLLARAWEIAETVIMPVPRIQRRMTREVLMQPFRELYVKEIRASMAHEAWACEVEFPGVERQLAARNPGE
jgi:enoyl-CoA hydratase/carnithine racemase